TLAGCPSDLNVRNTTLFQWPDLSAHNLNRFLDEMKLVIDLGFIQRKSKCFARISISSGLTRESRIEFIVITKALTLRGLARSFLLRASAATLAFPGSSHELSVVESCKLSPSPSVSILYQIDYTRRYKSRSFRSVRKC
ncbi:hypothetical protein Tco_0854558, partial [Tanacetum coccineum]